VADGAGRRGRRHDAAQLRRDIPGRLQIVVRAPKRDEGSRDRREIAQQDATAVVRTEGSETLVAAGCPAMREMTTQRTAADVHDPQVRRQGRPCRQRAGGLAGDFIQHAGLVALEAQQQPKRRRAQRPGVQPGHERRALNDAAETHPALDAGEGRRRARRVQRPLHVGAALAQARQQDPRFAPGLQPVEEHGGVFLKAAETADGNHFHARGQPLHEFDDA